MRGQGSVGFRWRVEQAGRREAGSSGEGLVVDMHSGVVGKNLGSVWSGPMEKERGTWEKARPV